MGCTGCSGKIGHYVNTYDYFKAELNDLDVLSGYDPFDGQLALTTLMEHDERLTGIVYENPNSVCFDNCLPSFRVEDLAHQSLEVDPSEFNRLVATYR